MRGLTLAIALVLAPVALADHVIKIRNTCGRTVTPMFHGNGTTFTMATLHSGGTTSTSIPEDKAGWRIFGQTGQCGVPDGGGCTLLECSFNNPLYRQCDISRVDGFNVGLTFSWSDSGCSGNSCLSSSCNGNHAFSDATNGGPSIRQCNTPNVGMTVTFSC